MSLTVKGKLIRILHVESGVARSGNPWKKQEFVVETHDQFPRKICFTLFNDKVSLIEGLAEGDELEVSFDVESREFNNKWYHNINAWKVEKSGGQPAGEFPPPFTEEDLPPEPVDSGTDLPF
ncbi:MAG: DUF3127 domain-containing protein [Prolixibacteraceae bacterium]|jgi:hypothetical protein|nr:DUF3127 domain-containing protein [Prolixibacteraceae bacterium]NLX28191.1 DUF3127 domain-containing protein [Bacteroidales bacterium]HPJ78304.1 DUF3127 domain-containing protein [Prolixibacteraceae bacterium]HRV89209.1 DUF3127 domain-containing protein [Prolixibacteraceae bacterium]